MDGSVSFVATSSTHEALHRIFQDHPPLIVTSLNDLLGIDFPQPKEVSVLNVDLTEMRPIERRADTAMLMETAIGKHLVVIESQSVRDETQKQSWPYYVAYLHNKHECPVILLVTTSDLGTARWARKPIKVGLRQAPSQITQPLVLGPDNVPPIKTVDEAHADVALAVLSAVTHRHSPDVNVILEALDMALAQEDKSAASDLAEFVEAGLGETTARQIWRKIMGTMTHEYLSELRRKGQAEGRLQEAAAAVLRVLEARGLTVPESVARRVNECTDLAVLEGLLTRAVTVGRADDLFGDPSA